MAIRNKGKNASKQQFNKNQIDIIKFFRDFQINILKHKTIHGIMVGAGEYDMCVSDDVKLIGFVSVPMDNINQDMVIEDKISKINYGVIGDTTCVVDEKFNLDKVEDEYQVVDNCAILNWLQEAVDEGLCEFAKSFDILYLEPIRMSDFEDLSNDMNER
jgi:hypothetical protein